MTDANTLIERERSKGTLAMLESAGRALASASSLQDILSVRDKSEAIRQLLKVQRHSLESQNKAAEIKIRAERRLGESLAKMDIHGSNQHKRKSHDVTSLTDLGIERMQSHRWQLIASLPDEEFNLQISDAAESGRELTTAAMLRAAKVYIGNQSPIADDVDVDVPEEQPLTAAISRLNEILNDVAAWWPEGMLCVLGDRLIEVGQRILKEGPGT